MKRGSKYFPLFQFLQQQAQDEVTLSFTDIESLLQASLPASARRQRGWWSNRSSGALQAQAWMEAGYHVARLDLEEERVTWRKPQLTYVARQIGDTVQWTGELVRGLRRHLSLTQEELAELLSVRQQTVSEWERGAYLPSRSTSKYLSMVAEKAGFHYEVESDSDSK